MMQFLPTRLNVVLVHSGQKKTQQQKTGFLLQYVYVCTSFCRINYKLIAKESAFQNNHFSLNDKTQLYIIKGS